MPDIAPVSYPDMPDNVHQLSENLHFEDYKDSEYYLIHLYPLVQQQKS
jgi:hypothetical protein